MADKKITDLQAIAAVTDSVNIPVDNGSQTYRATALQLKTYIAPLTTIGDLLYAGASGVASRLAAGTSGYYLKANGAAAPSWAAFPAATPPKMTVYTSGSGTHSFTGSPICVKFHIVGGGGGGGGSGTSNSTAGTAGSNTTLGVSTAGYGVPGTVGGIGGGTNTSTLGSGPVGLAILGGGGGGGGTSSTTGMPGGKGGDGSLGGGGATANTAVGYAGAANTGGGGGGGGVGSGGYSGAGGGSGGTVRGQYTGAALTALSGSIAYSVGGGGAGASAGSGGLPGAAGGSGIVIIEEIYQ